jgi:hypothetical protein
MELVGRRWTRDLEPTALGTVGAAAGEALCLRAGVETLVLLRHAPCSPPLLDRAEDERDDSVHAAQLSSNLHGSEEAAGDSLFCSLVDAANRLMAPTSCGSARILILIERSQIVPGAQDFDFLLTTH